MFYCRSRLTAHVVAFLVLACGPDRTGPSINATIVFTPTNIAFAAVEGGGNPTTQTVAITELSGAVLANLTVSSIVYNAGQPTGWLTAQLSGPTAPATLALNAAVGTLTVGTYNATVNIASDNASNSPLALPVTFAIAAPQSAVISLSTNAIAFTATTGTTSPAAQTVNVTNSGAGTLNVDVGTIAYGGGQPTGWLAASLNATTAPATLTLTATLGSLAAGSYTATVPVTSTNGVNSPQNVTVGFTVTAPPSTGLINANCSAYPKPVVPAPLRTFYVDAANGNDASAGTSLATAWKTITKANATVQAGDLVLLRGTFTGQALRPAVSGTASNKIVYKVDEGQTATLSQGQFDAGLWLDSRSHIVVDGLEITNMPSPVLLRFGANANWLFNLNIHDTGAGIIINNSDDNRVEGSTLLRIGNEVANSGDAVFIQDGADRNIIVRNTVSYAGHGTLWVSFQGAAEATANDNVFAQNDTFNPWASGMGLNGKALRTIVECNKIHHAADGSGPNYARSGLEIEGTDNIIRYNEIYRNGAVGVTLQGRTFAGFLQHATGNQIYGNTFWRNGNASVQFAQRDAGTVRNNIIENNVFLNDAGLLDQSQRYAVLMDMFQANANNVLAPGDFGGNIVRNSIFPPNQVLVLMIRKAGDGGNNQYTLAQALSALAGWTAIQQTDALVTNEGTDNVILLDNSPAIDFGRIISGQLFLGAAPDAGARERK